MLPAISMKNMIADPSSATFCPLVQPSKLMILLLHSATLIMVRGSDCPRTMSPKDNNANSRQRIAVILSVIVCAEEVIGLLSSLVVALLVLRVQAYFYYSINNYKIKSFQKISHILIAVLGKCGSILIIMKWSHSHMPLGVQR